MNDVDAINTIVGRNLVAQRKARGLTLDQLAQASEVSRGMIVQIEQGKTKGNPLGVFQQRSSPPVIMPSMRWHAAMAVE